MDILFCCSGGIGDCLMGGAKPAFFITNGDFISVEAFVRDEVFIGLEYIFRTSSKRSWLSIIQNDKKEYFGSDYIKFVNEFFPTQDKDVQVYYNIPDFLYKNPHAFDWKKYNLHPNTIRQQRLFIDDWKPSKKIYCAVNSTTQGYQPSNISAILRLVSQQNPDYEIIFPNITKWANIQLDYGDLSNLPSNIRLIENPDICSCIDLVRQSDLVICTDNLISHLAFETGIPRILLDPQFGRNMFTARWREDISESIPISTSPRNVAELSKQLLEDSTLCLIPRMELLNGNVRGANWGQELLYKF